MKRKKLALLATVLLFFAGIRLSYAQAGITVTKARIGCLDIQTDGNLTGMVAQACNRRMSCSFKAPTEDQYKRAGVRARTRSFCTQAMEITYRCGPGEFHTVTVPGDAWKNPPAQLSCSAPVLPAHTPRPDAITVSRARIGCLDIQTSGNLTNLVARACNDRASCSYKAPTEAQYKRAGVVARTRTFCTQAMEITYQCGHNDFQTVLVPGDAWNQPPAHLICNPPPPPANQVLSPGVGPIMVSKARIGCLDVQTAGNLTNLVAGVCNGRLSCSYQAPTEDAYKRAGVQASTRPLCSQAMEITYRCGHNDDQVVTVPGDAWNRPPAHLSCDGHTVASNYQDVTPPVQGSASEPSCEAPHLGLPDYYIAPANMLDWTTNSSDNDLVAGFKPAPQPTRDKYNWQPVSGITGAPGSTLGANEGRLRPELREVARKKDPVHALCQAAQRFTRNAPATADMPSDQAFGDAFADLSVTGKTVFKKFRELHPNEAILRAQAECAGASAESLTKALKRAYAVANALRGEHDSAPRQQLHWIAVSGEDDQPYRPVNVPSTKFPQFDIRVLVPKFNNIAVNTRYMIAHAPGHAPNFQRPAAPLVDGGPGYQVAADPLPALAPDAQVILFIHGMDSRLEEANDLTAALHNIGGKNWTVISLDLPSSGYADNINHQNVSRISDVQCHNTPLVDFIEEFIVDFVDTLDGELRGQLKPKIKAVVGGSLGGNMAMRLGRRPNTPWITAVVPWSPAAIWPSYVAQHHAVAAGCDTSYDPFHDKAVNQSLGWAGKDDEKYLPNDNELPQLRRELFYGGFDWSPVGGLGGPPQAQCWFSENYKCKQQDILAARLDRQETYDTNFRAWHWRLGAEQLAFSHQLFAPGTKDPLYLQNRKRMLLLTGYDDTCASLGEDTRKVAAKMVNTPGFARFLKQTGHSLDNEHPEWVARQIVDFLR